MDYTGIIIEESLQDKTILEVVKITDTKIEQVTPEHKTPWLTTWTLHTVTVPADRANEIAEVLSRSLDGNSWYVDFRNQTTHYIIFPGRIFKVDRAKPEQYEAARAYGLSLGIPEHQLTWSSELTEP
ncbi:MAG TPA: hypothetical protein VLE99_02855 [Candidatus Saccharimonadales bacterium]|nr:hypothetical protein [Candidatus Saccharimonadales bacterium]